MKYGEITLDEPEEDKDRKLDLTATVLAVLEDAVARNAPAALDIENMTRVLCDDSNIVFNYDRVCSVIGVFSK